MACLLVRMACGTPSRRGYVVRTNVKTNRMVSRGNSFTHDFPYHVIVDALVRSAYPAAVYAGTSDVFSAWVWWFSPGDTCFSRARTQARPHKACHDSSTLFRLWSSVHLHPTNTIHKTCSSHRPRRGTCTVAPKPDLSVQHLQAEPLPV